MLFVSMAYHLIERSEVRGRRRIGTYETREQAEQIRRVMIKNDPQREDVLFIVDDQDEENAAETD